MGGNLWYHCRPKDGACLSSARALIYVLNRLGVIDRPFSLLAQEELNYWMLEVVRKRRARDS